MTALHQSRAVPDPEPLTTVEVGSTVRVLLTRPVSRKTRRVPSVLAFPDASPMSPPLTAPHDDPASPSQAEPSPVTAPVVRPGLYRVVWRWHFYAGVLVAPVLFVVAMTGAIYVFKDELDRVLYADTMFVTPQPTTVPLERQVAAAEAAYPGARADTVEVEADPTRATAVRIRGGQTRPQRVYVNPHTGAVQGAIGDDSFFRVVLDLHRRLFIGTTGRAVVEAATSWTVVLLLTGLYLWFPRRPSLRGVLVPRLRARPYTVLRDLHAVAGAVLAPVAVVITLTGLVYSLVFGSGYSSVSSQPAPAHASVSPPGAPPLPLDRAVAVTRDHYPGASFVDVRLPEKPRDAVVARAKLSETGGPRHQVVLALDRSTGEVIDVQRSDQYPPLRWWRTTWNYPLHVGNVLGTPTKVVWLLACLVLAALPVTGLMMWWRRRPAGRAGFPRRPDRSVPVWLLGGIGLVGVFLPTVGASILLILLGEWLAGALRSDARSG